MTDRTDPWRERLLPVWSCSRRGLPSRTGHPIRWCALTAPFHPYRSMRIDRRFAFCCTVPIFTDGGGYPPPRPVEPGLSSKAKDVSLGLRDRSADFDSCIIITYMPANLCTEKLTDLLNTSNRQSFSNLKIDHHLRELHNFRTTFTDTN